MYVHVCMYVKTRVKIPKFLHFWQISQIPGIIDPAMRDPISIAPPARGARLLGLRYRQVPPSHPLFESIIYSSNLRVGGWDFQKPKDLHQKPKEVKMETEKADKSKKCRLPRSPKGEGRLRPRNASSPSPAQRRAESAVRGDQDPALDVEQRSVAVQWQAGQDRRGGGQD